MDRSEESLAQEKLRIDGHVVLELIDQYVVVDLQLRHIRVLLALSGIHSLIVDFLIEREVVITW